MTEPAKITIKLYGALRQRFGKSFTFVGRAPADAIKALCMMKAGFRQYLADHSEPGFHVLAGERDLGEDELNHPVRVVKLVPVVVGRSAGLRIIAGAALVALSFWGPWPPSLPGSGRQASLWFSVAPLSSSPSPRPLRPPASTRAPPTRPPTPSRART
jgi:predicted phage tail protein